MTEEIIEQVLIGKKRKKSKSIIGIDPLAWMNDADNDIDIKKTSLELETVIDNVDSIQVVSDEVSEEIVDVSIEEESINADVMQQNGMEEVDDMDMGNTDFGLNGKFKLEGPITIADVSLLHEKFKTSLENNSEFEVDCSEVEGVDAAALQLLVACINEVEKQDKKLIWKEPSESMLSAVNLLGLQNEVKL